MTHKIILIEDQKKDAEKILGCLNELAVEHKDRGDKFQFEHLKGKIEDTYEGEEYLHYDEDVIKEIEKKYSETDHNEMKMGILLDVMLTRKDLESNLSSYYPQVELAKKIYFKFKNQMPVYIITSTPVFATQSDVIMGVDLSEQYIAKNALLKYKLEDNINNMFEYYRNFVEK